MCVILAVPEGAEDIDEYEFFSACTTNSDGYGIAWIQDGRIAYKKTLDPSEEDITWRPKPPYAMHFRLATVGDTSSKLCHPFPVGNARLKKRGVADKVLFHNGHIIGWEELLMAAYSGVGRLPKGPYSDSRAMALLASRYGEAVFELQAVIEAQRYLIFDKTGFSYFGNWKKGDDKVWRSNENHLYYHKPKPVPTKPCKECGVLTTNEEQLCYTCSHSGKCEMCQSRDTLPGKYVCKKCDDALFNECAECENPLVNLQSRIEGRCYGCRRHDTDPKELQEDAWNDANRHWEEMRMPSGEVTYYTGQGSRGKAGP